ncbi:DNA alkylation repair protein [Hominifimenecus sp. rT4P-3]|uniref:DNA alkylation repair protein n=1 Tax=Hominifimenecus sp. rT4P-3 TaxID=3242979 RepID=UPI003DA4B8BF
MNKEEKLREELIQLAEPSYRDFSSRLIPNLQKEKMLGVRLPALRKIAKRLAKEDGMESLKRIGREYFEETMLRGMVIGCVPISFREKIPAIKDFLPEIANWSVCDSFCAGLKGAAKEPEAAWELIQECLADTRTYFRRFALVMEMNYFLDDAHVESVLESTAGVGEEDYYVKMAAGWCLAECYAAAPEKTDGLLRSGRLNPDVFRLALRKIRESHKISERWQANAKKIRDIHYDKS